MDNLTDTSLIDAFPYASRLGSNDIPSENEMEEIKAFLSHPTEQLKQMETEIGRLQAELDSLSAKHRALEAQVTTCRSLITIPRRLPDDILREIFLHCLPKNCNPTMSNSTAPLLLTVVCRRWRIVTHEIPALWSAIHIPIHDERNPWIKEDERYASLKALHEPLYPALSEWLGRSRTRPLTLSFFLRGDNSPRHPMNDITANYVQNMIPVVSRLRSLFFEGSCHSFSNFSTIPATDFPLLESLFLELGDEGEQTNDFRVAILKAPHLRKVSIRQSYLRPISLRLPWDTLTHLDLGGGTRSTCPGLGMGPVSSVLKLCTLLVFCSLRLHTDTSYGPVEPMYLPRLQRLSIRHITLGRGSNDVSNLFSEKLTTPCLRELSLRGFGDEAFLALLSNIGQTIQSFDIDCQYIGLNSFANSIRHCPRISYLFITNEGYHADRFEIGEVFFQLFTRNHEESGSPLCPFLQEVYFDRIPCNTLPGLLSFLESKQAPDSHTSKLLKVSIYSILDSSCKTIPDEIILDRLKPYTDHGLVFQINTPRPFMETRRGSESTYSIYGFSSPIQYADCWRDSDSD